MAALQSSLDHLDRLDFGLVHNDSMQEVNAALAACAQALQHWHEGGQGPRPMSVYPSAVVYDSVAQRDQKWNLYLENNPAIAAQHTPAEWEEEKQAYGILGNAVNGASQRHCVFYVVSMQNPVFSHSWHMRHWNGQDTPALRAKFYTGDIEWHEFVLVLNQREVFIYDPSYVLAAPPTPTSRRNLKSLPLIGAKAYKVISELRGARKLAVARVFVGGGGNAAGQCREMSLRWIRQGVEQMVTTEKWEKGEPGAQWERVNLA